MSRLTLLPWRGWGEGMPGRRAGGNCAAKPRGHTIAAPPRISWRCRFSPITFRTGSPSLASRARSSSGISSDETSRLLPIGGLAVGGRESHSMEFVKDRAAPAGRSPPRRRNRARVPLARPGPGGDIALVARFLALEIVDGGVRGFAQERDF